MNKKKFEKSVIITADINELYDFHTNTNNLKIISPVDIDVEIIDISSTPLKKDSQISLKIKKGLFSFSWKIKIKEADPPRLISDLQEEGIFKFWLHHHIFEKVNGGVKMTDKVEYIPPFGFLGELGDFIIKYELNKMFDIRHRKTKLYFERNYL